MVEFVTLLKDTFQKFKLQAEVAVLERDSTNRQRAFGVELYDLIEKQTIDMRKDIETTLEKQKDPKVQPEDVENVLQVFRTIENEIKGPLESCRADIEGIMGKEVLGNVHKMMVEKRKGDFGVEIWPIVSQPKWLHESLEQDFQKALSEQKDPETPTDLNGLMNVAIQGVVKGTKTTIAKAIGKLSPEEREVEACVSVAKKEIAVFESAKTEKLTELEALVSGGTTLECC